MAYPREKRRILFIGDPNRARWLRVFRSEIIGAGESHQARENGIHIDGSFWQFTHAVSVQFALDFFWVENLGD